MSLTQLPSGRWRAQCYHNGRNVSVSDALGLPKGTTWATKREAKAAREDARRALATVQQMGVTVAEFRERWISDPLFQRPKESTNLHNAERTKAFAEQYEHRELASINDQDVSQWIRDHQATVPALRAMFNDAASAVGGRVVTTNPFAGLRLERSKGRAQQQPPTVEEAWGLIDAAQQVSTPGFAGWLQTAMWTGMRPGELDALTWQDVDLDEGFLTVRRQWSAKAQKFTLPKNGLSRPVPLHRETLEAIQAQPQVSEYVFVTLSGAHWRPSSRAYHWKATAAKAGWEHTLYLATRHFAGWFMYNELLQPAEDVAFALGHTDGGQLVKTLYGHRDRDAALDRMKRAYEAARGENVAKLRSVG